MKLIIVESPTKARTLSRFLGPDFTILASMGHVMDLPKKKLGVDIKKGFKPEYVSVDAKKEIITKLKKQALKASQIILATDLDREGEAIAYHIATLLRGGLKAKISRIVFHEITRQAINNALKNPGKINKQLVEAQQARRILDRLVGYKLSPLLWFKIRRGLSAGRVQSPAVRLIVEREREIKKFKPQEYWKINVKLKNKKSFLAFLVKINNKKAEVKNKEQVDKILKDLEKAVYKVDKIQTKEVKNNPPPPFITSTLQRTASGVFKWSARKTMVIAQKLYENGFITYHRTDSVHLSTEAVLKARDYIKAKFGSQYLPENQRIFKIKSKLAQEAHEAIRPTKIGSRLKGFDGELSRTAQSSRLGRDNERLYKLIFNRFIACQMREQVIERTIVDITANGHLLKAQGEIEKFKGWKAVYPTLNNQSEKFIPQLEPGEPLQLIKVLPEQKFTQPPARYTEGSLIKALEEHGIGRPSTYAPIISTIQSRLYVEKVEAHFLPTPVGETVNDFLVKYFLNIVDYDFTAKMEDNLDEVAHGKIEPAELLKEFYAPFEKELNQVAKNAKRAKIKAEKIGKKCPNCKKGEQVIRVGRFGKFLSCSRFPDCKWKGYYIEKLKGVKCLKCKGDVIIRKTRKGKQFYGCSNWPKCNWASWRKPKT